MNRERRQPFRASYDMCCAHKMVVDDVCKMISRNTVHLENDNILIVFGHRECASDTVLNFDVAHFFWREVGAAA